MYHKLHLRPTCAELTLQHTRCTHLGKWRNTRCWECTPCGPAALFRLLWV